MTLAVRINNRLALCGDFAEEQIPAIARSIRDSMQELRLYQRVLITCSRGNVTSIVYSH